MSFIIAILITIIVVQFITRKHYKEIADKNFSEIRREAHRASRGLDALADGSNVKVVHYDGLDESHVYTKDLTKAVYPSPKRLREYLIKIATLEKYLKIRFIDWEQTLKEIV